MLNPKNKKYYVPNLIKAIKILEVLSQSQVPLAQSAIAKTTGFGTSIVFRILTTLEDCEYVKKSDGRTYTVSKKFLPMSLAASNEDDVVRNSLDILDAVRDELLETALLGALADNSFCVIAHALGRHSFSFHCKTGTICPLHTGAPCKAVIAYLPKKERDETVSKIKFEKFNSNTISSKKEYLKELEDVASRGYALDREEYIRGMRCVAAPVFNERGYPVAAIWVTGPVERMSESSFEKTGLYLKSQAEIISRRMGWLG